MAGSTFSRIQKMTTAFLLCIAILTARTSVCASSPTPSSANVRSAPLRSVQNATNGMVRVYLSSIGSLTSLDITTSGSYSIGQGAVLPSGTQINVSIDPSSGQISVTSQGEKRQFGKEVTIRRRSGAETNGIYIRQSRESGNPYPGDLSFHAVYSGGSYKLYAVVHVYIEKYLYGVLPYEMGNSSNVEALKAQAVAARTYTVRMMKMRASGLYDVKDTTSDQVYRGTPSGNANCVAAIDATKGVVLMYGSNYITTYYSSSNGGQTEISRSGSSYAYMTVKDDPFDYANPSSTVKKKTVYCDLQHSGNNAQLISLLKSKAAAKLRQLGYNVSESDIRLGTLQNIKLHTPKYPSPSRLYTKIDFTFSVVYPSVSSITVTCDVFGELEGRLGMSIQSDSNELWSVVDNGSTMELQARRYGHGLGMSQRGAMYMAKLGYSYDQILGFYYEGCERVKHSFTQTVINASGDEEIKVEDPTDDEMTSPSGCYGIIHGTDTMIRNDQSSGAAIIGAVSSGAMVTVLAVQDNWCFIQYGALKGFMPTSSLQISGEPNGSIEASSQIAGFVTVTAKDFVNLRASDSMSAKIVGTAVSGAVLTVLQNGNGWAKVQHNALVAYVNTGFVSGIYSQYPFQSAPSEPDAVAENTVRAVVTTQQGSLNMRLQPYAGSQILTTIPRNAEIAVTERGNEWSGVFYRGMNGYVMTSFLTFLDDSVQTPDPPNVGQTATVVTPSGTLNLRDEPRTGSGIIARIPPGSIVSVITYGAEWSQVEWNGRTGYVMTVFLSFDVQPDPGQPDSNEPETDTEGIHAIVTTKSGSLNLRMQPSQASDVIAQIPQGSTVAVSQHGQTWSSVVWNGYSGYVMTDFLTFVPAQEETPDHVPEETPDEPGGESATPQHTSALVDTVSGSLNVRSEPSTIASVLGTLPKGARVEVMAYGSQWCAVRSGAVSGYVMTRYLRFESNAQEPESPKAEIAWVNTASGSLNLRSEANASSFVLLSIPQFAKLKVEESMGTWTRVTYQGVSGYVMSQFLTYDEPAQKDAGVRQEEIVVSGVDVTMHAPQSAMYAVPSQETGITLWAACVEDGEMVGFVPADMQVEVLLIGEHWACVQYRDGQGYCKTNQLSVIEP